MITADDLMACMPLIADQEWTIDHCGWIRNREKQCPVCALVSVLTNDTIHFLNAAHQAAFEMCRIYDIDNFSIQAVDEIIHTADRFWAKRRNELEVMLGLA